MQPSKIPPLNPLCCYCGQELRMITGCKCSYQCGCGTILQVGKLKGVVTIDVPDYGETYHIYQQGTYLKTGRSKKSVCLTHSLCGNIIAVFSDKEMRGFNNWE